MASKRATRARSKRAPRAPWMRRLEADRRILGQRAARSAVDRPLSEAAPRLADSRYADELDRTLERFPDAGRSAPLAVAIGRRALVHDNSGEALRRLVEAQSLVNGKDVALVARIAFLLGSVYLGRSELVAADAVLAWAEGTLGESSKRAADVVHLTALIDEAHGRRDEAMAQYRRALQLADTALTPMSRVLALRNLAEALAHSEPHESAGLYGLALAIIDTDELDPVLRCAIDNGMGYALLCTGDIDGARLKLTQALTEARRVDSQRVQLYARFNLAIVDELSGDLAQAESGLRAIEQEARRHGLEPLSRWSLIRIAWLCVRGGQADGAAAALREAFPSSPGRAYREPVTTLRSILQLHERRAAPRDALVALAAAYRERGDALTEFTLTLWIARADAIAGRLGAARRNVARACELGAARGFRLGTSWWAPELVGVAREHASPEYADFVDRLVAPPSVARAEVAPQVAVSRDADIAIDGVPLEGTAWRVGRSGSGVLRRYFRALLSAYPAALARDELADLLWPESEGDKAVRNLYTATKDLRVALALLPGVQLQVSEGAYRLVLAANVRLS